MSKLSDKLNLKNDFPESGYDEWKQIAESDLKGVTFDKKLITKTYEGIDLQPIYTKESLEDNPFSKNFPGFENFVRGSKSSGYNANSWEVARELPIPDPAEFNSALVYDLERGQDTVILTPDNATLYLKNPDSTKDAGVGGTSLCCIADLETAFKEVDLTKNNLILEAGFTALPLMAMFASYCGKNGIDLNKINVSVTSSPIGFVLSHGESFSSFKKSFDDMSETVKWTSENEYLIKTINVNGSVYVNAGASAVQELAFIISEANEYISQMLERGMMIDDIAGSMMITSGVSTFYFMEISKFRALRILWSNLIDVYGGKSESKSVHVHAKTSAYYHAKNDIYVNLLRTATGAFSAILGGIDSLHSSAFDETTGMSDEFSRRIARNTQNILKEESHLNSLIDPAGGSYYIESLTSSIATEAWKLFKQIENEGGMLEAIRKGIVQRMVKNTSAGRKKDYANRKTVIVGNNMYANIKEERTKQRKFDSKKFVKSRKEFLNSLNSEFKPEKLINRNTDALIKSFSAGATLGDISGACGYNDNHEKIEKLNFERASEIFEELRNISFDYKEKHGKLPGIFLASFGPLKQHKPRADFSRGFFEVGGFDVIYKKGFNSIDEAVSESVKSCVNIFALCSTDDTYPDLVPEYVMKIKSSVKDAFVVLAGYPKEQIEEYKKCGIDEFIFLGADVYDINMKLLKSVK